MGNTATMETVDAAATQANKDLVRIIFHGFSAHGLGRVAAICAHQFVLEDLPAGITLRGPEGMRGWLLFGEGENIVTEHCGTATHTGPPQTPNGGLPATGAKPGIWFSENDVVRDGKLVSRRVFYDGAGVLRQFGRLGA